MLKERGRRPCAPTEAPIYVKSYSLVRYLIDRIENLCQKKYSSLGQNLEQHCIGFLECICLALKGMDKATHLNKADETLARIRINIRLLYDFSVINLKQLQYITEQLEEIGRMLGGWIRRGALRAPNTQ